MQSRRKFDLDSVFRQFVAGDNAAFLLLYEHFNPRFGIYCIKRYRLSHVETEDVLQSVWERVLRLRAGDKLRTIDNFGAFLFRSMTNSAVDALRRRRETVAIDEEDVRQLTTVESESIPFARLNAYVMEAFQALNDDHREVLILQLYCGYDLSEIAQMVGKSADAIWARASRARNELRRKVAERAERDNIPLSEFKVLAG